MSILSVIVAIAIVLVFGLVFILAMTNENVIGHIARFILCIPLILMLIGAVLELAIILPI